MQNFSKQNTILRSVIGADNDDWDAELKLLNEFNSVLTPANDFRTATVTSDSALPLTGGTGAVASFVGDDCNEEEDDFEDDEEEEDDFEELELSENDVIKARRRICE